MAKGSKGSKKKSTKRDRRERRFEARVTTPPGLVATVGGLGAAALGAGFYGQFVQPQMGGDVVTYAAPVIAGGALLTAIAIWIGTTSEAMIRVGDAGMARERGGLERMPWYAVKRIGWKDSSQSLIVEGTVDGGASAEWIVPRAAHPLACGFIVREARARVPAVLDVPDNVAFSEATEGGEVLTLDPPQVVGRRCAASDVAIAYEPDARLCDACERVYHKDHVPSECACGHALGTSGKESAAIAAPDTGDAVPA
ncbi:MAG: hypothetical protein U0169_00615 [Polyangiaceae bacterium]